MNFAAPVRLISEIMRLPPFNNMHVNGKLTLSFPHKNLGDKVSLIVNKKGYTVDNDSPVGVGATKRSRRALLEIGATTKIRLVSLSC